MTAVYDGGAWGIGIGAGDEAQPLPGAVFDSSGLHLTLESARIVDIPFSEIEKRIVYDQELNLVKIYDKQGVISAEYDAGVGQPGSADYIPGQGWVDLQKLADEACYKRDGTTYGCFFENVRGLPSGTVNTFFASTGIFSKIVALDAQTNEPMGGEFLLLQFVTRNTTDKPVIGWTVIQASDFSQPGINVLAGVSQGMQIDDGVPLSQTDKNLRSIEQWQSWMPKGSLWDFGFLPNEGVGPFWSRSQLLGSADYQENKTQFLTSHGDISPDGIYPFFPNSGESAR